MPKIASYTIPTDYFNDRGENVANVKGRFVMPSDMSDAAAIQLIQFLGGVPSSIGGVRQPNAIAEACISAQTQGFKPRRITLCRSNGNTLSAIMPTRPDLNTTAQAVVGVVAGLNGNIEVQSVQLFGEEYDNILSEALADGGNGGRQTTPGTPIRPAPGDARGKLVYSGRVQYNRDVTYGQTELVSVKVDTDQDGSPPSVLSGEWADCTGDLQTINAPCSSSAFLDHRRYIVISTYQEAGSDRYQSTEIPVTDHLPAGIRSCGNNIAANAAVICLGYRGESLRNIRNIL